MNLLFYFHTHPMFHLDGSLCLALPLFLFPSPSPTPLSPTCHFSVYLSFLLSFSSLIQILHCEILLSWPWSYYVIPSLPVTTPWRVITLSLSVQIVLIFPGPIRNPTSSWGHVHVFFCLDASLPWTFIVQNGFFQIVLWRLNISFQLDHIIIEGKNYILFCGCQPEYVVLFWAHIWPIIGQQFLSWCAKWWN